MDKKTVIGIVLIVIITLMMPFYQRWITGDQPPPGKTDIIKPDSAISQQPAPTAESRQPVAQEPAGAITPDTLTEEKVEISGIRPAEKERIIEIENNLVNITLSTQNGGNPVSWILKEYEYYLGGKVNLIDNNNLGVSFLNRDGKQIDLTKYNMHLESDETERFVFGPDQDSCEVKFFLPINEGRLVKVLRFYRNKYDVDVEIKFEGLQDYVINRKYTVSWNNGLPPTEKNVSDDNSYAKAFAYMAEELEDFDASDEQFTQENYNGRVDWLAIRTKYFLSAIIPENPAATLGATLGGSHLKNEVTEKKIYNVALESEFVPSPDYSQNFKLYLGPLDYFIVDNYNVELETLVMNSGWYERTFRLISLLIIPAFEFLHRFIPNYGVVIIIFSILVKLLLHPLTKKSYQSMSEMQYLQPKMTELREKYKSDPQRMNKEVMKLYKEHGVNPMGGCLPMLLQMPLLIALFTVFRSTIQLRGEPFVLWIKDLSAPDTLFTLSFSLPVLGDSINVLPFVMGVTMIWQSKASITDPKQKLMVYFMPIFMIFIFYSLPSGLNLYYTIFNLLSMLQTRQIKKKMHPDDQTPQQAANRPGKKTSGSKKKIQSK